MGADGITKWNAQKAKWNGTNLDGMVKSECVRALCNCVPAADTVPVAVDAGSVEAEGWRGAGWLGGRGRRGSRCWRFGVLRQGRAGHQGLRLRLLRGRLL